MTFGWILDVSARGAPMITLKQNTKNKSEKIYQNITRSAHICAGILNTDKIDIYDLILENYHKKYIIIILV